MLSAIEVSFSMRAATSKLCCSFSFELASSNLRLICCSNSIIWVFLSFSCLCRPSKTVSIVFIVSPLSSLTRSLCLELTDSQS